MAVDAAVVWELRTTGSANNGGGFKAGASGTDRSQSNTQFVDIDGSTISATVHTTTTQITITGYTVVTADIGNILSINGGTATVGKYEIIAVDTTNNRWTLDRSAGSSTQTVIGKMGGACAALADISGTWQDGNSVYIKQGTYNVSGVTTVSKFILFFGYDVARGDQTANQPIIKANSGTSYHIMDINTYSCHVHNICFDGNSASGVRGLHFVNGWGSSSASRCIFKNCPDYGCFSGTGGNVIFNCYATNCNIGIHLGSGSLAAFGHCDGNTSDGWELLDTTECLFCLATANAQNGFGLTTGAGNSRFIGCISSKNGNHAFSALTGVSSIWLINCIGWSNSGYLLNTLTTGSAKTYALVNCASGSNGNDLNITPLFDLSRATLTVDPHTTSSSSAGGDYTLNNTSGGGADCRSTGWDKISLSNNGVGYIDIGTFQHQDTPATIHILTKRVLQFVIDED